MSFLNIFGGKKKISPVAQGIWVVNDLLEKSYCETTIQKIESSGFKVARQYNQGRHNKETFIQEKNIAQDLLAKFEKIILAGPSGKVQVTDFSFPLEFYKYESGDYIKTHSDAPREIFPGKWSTLTLVLYLTDGYSGGETFFPKSGLKVTPKIGCGLLFDQKLDHEALTVENGIKYVLRTNCLVKKV
jgi:Rps23 Pro-64 3,4-dihydroxylase Tpa1-like proline 4-hydroxylase